MRSGISPRVTESEDLVMATAKRFNESGDAGNTVELSEKLFGAEVHEQALYETVKSYLAHQRQGNAKTKERSEVSYSTAKLFRQKGTGRARAGSMKSPLRDGGGTVFGPKPRDFRTHLNRKTRRLALRSALSDRARLGEVYVVENPSLDAPKTKVAAAMLAKMGLTGRTTLVVTAAGDETFCKSLRNLEHVDVVGADQLNAYLVLRSECLVLTDQALARVEEVFGS
jgi:large subunit ribosomal protein L4